ncbi:MAG: hypothetical protein A2W90_04150 [Bacteroidetes bacterium GWF2_42_66]|nr:MAG: hypothetical protein A2W92_06965 [Bacteroidetes bacterium GWA2_42_15]OFY02488.1 MAG: hypothetical protein A2W89_21705 [Bacteroidetes bacterium GWE2_42_39]OFY41414.1 MAG: hypothetical protein A2W90_04150 [Bacteroidetes bacterium GWF2_42_66]HBL75381.1 alcohol dehydrogenase [Prolixibacteraceae bacterium]HCR90301.1 alcohol dehydrogenase [Prolixibacteraceae bacterium]
MKELIGVALFLLITGALVAQDLVQWRGPDRSGIYPDKGLLKEWPAAGPELLLEVDGLGGGYSSPVVYHDVIYVTGIRDSSDIITAIKMDGEKIWEKVYGRAWYRSYPENRSTPTIENGKIYLVSGMGEVVCLDAVSGNEVWKVDAHSTFKGELQNWGIAESVLLTDRAAIYTVGGEETSVIALDKINGNLLWKSKSLGGPRAYASPSLIEKNGMMLILAQTSNDLIALDPANGNVVWSYDLFQYHTHRMGKGAQTNTALFYNDEIFVTSGYDHPGTMFSLADDAKSVSLKWKNDTLDCHIGGVVMVDGKIFGSNWASNTGGNWACLDWKTGKTMYEETWNNKGSVIAADGMLYCYEEKGGNLALVRPNPEKFDIVSSFKIEKGTGPHWAHPSIYGGKLFVRHGEVLMVYKISN